MNKVLNKRNGIIAGAIAIAVVIAIIITTTMSSALTLDEAKDIAKKYVPTTAAFKNSEEEDNKFEVYFYDSANKESFEVEVYKESKKVKKVESQLDNDKGSTKVVLTEANAKAIAKEKFKDITSLTVNLTKDDGLYEYEVTFKAADYYGTLDINPETGAILESSIKYGTAVTIPANSNNTDGLITFDKARDAAIKHVGGGKVTDIDLDKEDGVYVYEIEVVKNGIEYDLIVDATTGKVTEESEHESHMSVDGTTSATQNTTNGSTSGTSSNNSSSNQISESKARSIVLGKIPGATIVKINLEKDDGIWVYEGEAKSGNYEYDFEINASTGVVISWERDTIDNDEDNDYDDDDDEDDDYDDDDDDDDDK